MVKYPPIARIRNNRADRYDTIEFELTLQTEVPAVCIEISNGVMTTRISVDLKDLEALVAWMMKETTDESLGSIGPA